MQVARVEGFVAWEKCLLCETRFRFPAVCQWSSKKKKKIENVILLWKGIRGSSDWHGTRDFHRIPVIWIAQARQRHSSSTQYYYVIDSFLCWRWRGAQAPDGQRRFTASFFFQYSSSTFTVQFETHKAEEYFMFLSVCQIKQMCKGMSIWLPTGLLHQIPIYRFSQRTQSLEWYERNMLEKPHGGAWEKRHMRILNSPLIHIRSWYN